MKYKVRFEYHSVVYVHDVEAKTEEEAIEEAEKHVGEREIALNSHSYSADAEETE